MRTGTTPQSELRAYFGSVAFAGVAFAMQQLLLIWLLVGVLELPAPRVGLLQALIGLPGIAVMLWGGARSDRTDPRGLLVRVYALAVFVPLGLAVSVLAGLLTVAIVTTWGLFMSCIVAFSSPGHQALLNRVAADSVQKTVTAATIIGFLVQILGLVVAGQLDRIGLTQVLVLQALCLGSASLLTSRLAATGDVAPATGDGGAIAEVLAGLRATFRNRVVFDALALNFLSSIFNAGAFLTVLPFILRQDYGGDAATFSFLMIVFFAGAVASNFVMLQLMPLLHPGRWFVTTQLSRIVVLLLLWTLPSWWLLVLAIALWGLNMGITTTLARTIVQESAEEEFRGRILSVYSLGLLGSPLIGASVLGWIIGAYGTASGLLPGMATSLLLFLYSLRFTTLWSYCSPSVNSN